MISLCKLSSLGFKVFYDPQAALLKVAEESFIYLEFRNPYWILGHSTNGRDIILRPDGNRGFQSVSNFEELSLEIQWIKVNGAGKAIRISLSLLL